MCFKSWGKMKNKLHLSQRHPFLIAEVFEVQRVSSKREPSSSPCSPSTNSPGRCNILRMLLSWKWNSEMNCWMFLNAPCLLTCSQWHSYFCLLLLFLNTFNGSSSDKWRLLHHEKLCNRQMWYHGLCFAVVYCSKEANLHWHRGNL